MSKNSFIGNTVYKVTKNDLKDNCFEWFHTVLNIIIFWTVPIERVECNELVVVPQNTWIRLALNVSEKKRERAWLDGSLAQFIYAIIPYIWI